MNNEPVAWFYAYPDDVEDKFLCGNTELIESMKSCGKDYIITPLYTHPSEHDLGIAEAIGFEKGHKSAEDMLRQQQAEIEALKAGKIRAYDNGYEDGRKPDTNNKPVAWMVAEMVFDTEETAIGIGKTYDDEIIPLYTQPVKELALTDEEMISIYEKDWSGIKCGLGRAVEQAILRKAQEK